VAADLSRATDIDTMAGADLDLAFHQILDPFLRNPGPAVYLGFVATGICNYLQTIGQRNVSAEKAAIIYSLDPVYGGSSLFMFKRNYFIYDILYFIIIIMFSPHLLLDFGRNLWPSGYIRRRTCPSWCFDQ